MSATTVSSIKNSASSGSACTGSARTGSAGAGSASTGSAGQDGGKRWAALDSRLERLASAADLLRGDSGDRASTAA